MKNNIIFFFISILLYTNTLGLFLDSVKIKNVDEFSDTLKEISKNLPTNINHGFNRISLLLPELSYAIESQENDIVLIKDKVISIRKYKYKLFNKINLT
ncbi:hypothetical protein DICPUDRAFT_147592 [Dictyostelium purpureum]|uniref:Uncharacterized protein n=1 Tax=Dictyostelium purpureum TaxID=5786 RepID=F0Z8W5_DICPU|nr:uncharacterized protein DICPUDRAFT_147592 [Dictyostelium purpureum]EGC39647.1 hypothetical protein DICPUDRAFT_147592 [Dictyostelium purpureum]|eukprot:XP_003283868.1 hypothetical protein DICPUDRAFT_147592 [Dictyostelium purpureum]